MAAGQPATNVERADRSPLRPVSGVPIGTRRAAKRVAALHGQYQRAKPGTEATRKLLGRVAYHPIRGFEAAVE